jgi:Arc/MetJ family transcription regulator
MKTTMNLKDDLVKQAMEATGVKEKTALVHLGLQELIRKAAYDRLIALGGSDTHAKAAPRRK